MLQVVSAVPLSESILEVEFNNDLEDNEYLRDPETYSLSGGLEARSVTRSGPRKVQLFVSPPMATDQLYAVEVRGGELPE